MQQSEFLISNGNLIPEILYLMEMKDILTFSNCLFVYDQINEDMPSNFDDFFTTSETNTDTIQGLEKIIIFLFLFNFFCSMKILI